MKRTRGRTSNIDKSLKFEEVFSGLKGFSRSELFAIVNESNRLLNLECCQVVLSVPDEIWRHILTLSFREKQNTSDTELFLRLLSCVSRRFSFIVADVVRFFFSHSEPGFSSWILARCTDLTSLRKVFANLPH